MSNNAMTKMNMRFYGTLFLVACCLMAVTAKDHAVGPWNIDYFGSIHFESNNNVYYENSSPESDTVLHIIPGLRAEYEKLQNILFEAELKVDILKYSSNSDADTTETKLHLQAKPVNNGGYLVFSEDYNKHQNHTPGTNGILETGINVLRLGGGYRGNHLDIALLGRMETATYSPSQYDELNYAEQQFILDAEYLFEGFYMLGSIASGTLNYSGSQLNDGRETALTVGLGKRFYPKNALEFSLTSLTQNHDQGDDFSGILFKLSGTHISRTGKNSSRLTFATDIIPSSYSTANFAEIMYLQLTSSHNFTRKTGGSIVVHYERDSFDTLDETLTSISINGHYTPMNVLPLKFIGRKPKKDREHRPFKPKLRFDFGLSSSSRKSDISTNEYQQMRIYAGIRGTI